MRRLTVSMALAAALAAAQTTAAERPVACKGNPAIVAACFTVHGTMTAHNGAPTFRIRNAATHRILGVHGDQDGLPPELIPILMAPKGDACPFTRERVGHMRMVCVESVKNLHIHPLEP